MTKVRNVTSKVKCTYGEKTTKWIYSLAKANKLHIDNERLHRLKKKWEPKKVNSYWIERKKKLGSMDKQF